jgi:Fe-S-cluster containining protein
MNLALSNFSRPIFGKQNKEQKLLEIGLALKQHEGICVFQNLKNKKCQIYDFAPFNCRFYPLLLSRICDDTITVEVDFSCPGIGKGRSIDLQKSQENLRQYMKTATTQIDLNIDEIENEWGKQKIWKEGERVTNEDVEYAKSVFFT